jgi:uncharacterized membrane protein
LLYINMSQDILFGTIVIGFLLFLFGQYIYISEREFEKRKKQRENEKRQK